MSTFGDIRSAIHNNDTSRVKKFIREYEGDNFSEAEAIARYFIDMCDEFPEGFSGFVWSGKFLEMRVGMHRVPLMKITNHATQSVILPLRRKALNKAQRWVSPECEIYRVLKDIDDWILGNIENWLINHDEASWPHISSSMLWCQRSKKIQIPHLTAAAVFLYAGQNINVFLKKYYFYIPCTPAERKALRLNINQYLLKEYKCPPSVI